MAQFDGRAFFARLLVALNERDIETLREMIQPDVQSVSPPSGERSTGFDAFIAEGNNYPGGVPQVEEPHSKIVMNDERWVLTPSYTVIPMASPTQYTAVLKVAYPDGRTWLVVLLVEIRDEKVARVESYYAPVLPAPLAASVAAYQHG